MPKVLSIDKYAHSLSHVLSTTKKRRQTRSLPPSYLNAQDAPEPRTTYPRVNELSSYGRVHRRRFGYTGRVRSGDPVACWGWEILFHETDAVLVIAPSARASPTSPGSRLRSASSAKSSSTYLLTGCLRTSLRDQLINQRPSLAGVPAHDFLRPPDRLPTGEYSQFITFTPDDDRIALLESKGTSKLYWNDHAATPVQTGHSLFHIALWCIDAVFIFNATTATAHVIDERWGCIALSHGACSVARSGCWLQCCGDDRLPYSPEHRDALGAERAR